MAKRYEEISEQGPREPLDELAELRQENERLHGQIDTVRRTAAGALSNGHCDGEYGAEYGKDVIMQIAHVLGVDLGQYDREPKEGKDE